MNQKFKKFLNVTAATSTVLVVIGSVAIEAVGLYAGYRIIENIKSAKAINESELSQNPNSEIYADDGKTLIWTNSKYQHRHLSIEDAPDILIDLLISTEDKTFWENEGFSLKGSLNALRGERGGSTITQQLIKNMRFVGKDISREDRKVQEIALAINMTKRFDKKQILEAYLNKTGFLESSYGFNTAMYLLYGHDISKDATSATDIAQYATIVGMLKNPTIYNPRLYPEDSKSRRDQVLLNAYENGKLSEDQYSSAKSIDISDGLKEQGWFTQQVYETASEHGSYVDSILTQLKDLGYDLDSDSNPIKVVSNLNINQNKWLQDEVANPYYYQNDRQQVAIAVTEPSTGNVLAQVGSRNGGPATDLNRAVQVTRSSGSTIKPFLDYAPLIEFAGLTANTTWQANETTYAGTNFVVRNYAGARYGTVTTQYALKMSLNVPAVLALESQKPWMNQVVMSRLGLSNHTWNEDGSISKVTSFGGSDALGINVSVVDFASAFSALANYGVRKSPNYLKSVEQSGYVNEIKSEESTAMSPATAYTLLSMLKTVGDPDGTGRFSAIREYSGYALKTGTVAYDDNAPIYSDESHSEYLGTASQIVPNLAASDTWVAGTTKSASVAMWDGFDDPSVHGNWINEHFLRRTELFKSVMKHFNEGKDTSDWSYTSEKVDMHVDSDRAENTAMNVNDLSKLKSLLKSDSNVQKAKKNTTKASKDQIEFAKKFDSYSLPDPYTKNLIDEFKNNNSLSPALSQLNLPSSTKIYRLKSDSTLEQSHP